MVKQSARLKTPPMEALITGKKIAPKDEVD